MSFGRFWILAVFVLFGVADIVRSQPLIGVPKSADSKTSMQVDSEHLFGFTMGTDLGEAGELEGEAEATGWFGKRMGSYSAISKALELKYSVTDDFRVAPLVSFVYHDISGVAGLEDRRQLTIQGAGAEFKYRLMDRERGPFGLTVGVAPQWNRVDGESGERVRQFGAAVSIAFDKELVAKRIYGAFNVLYEPDWTRVVATGEHKRDSIFGLTAALANQVWPGIFLGGEIRHLRKYEGLALETFAGEAFFLGPTFYAVLSDEWNVSLAWNAQISGHAVGDVGALDLVNFERHQVRVRFGYIF